MRTGLFATLVLMTLCGAALPVSVVAQTSQDERAQLWAALHRTLPSKSISVIDVYGENPSLTEVLFRSNGQTWLFSRASGELFFIQHAKLLPPGLVKAITFERSPASPGKGFFVLWQGGAEVLRIGGSE